LRKIEYPAAIRELIAQLRQMPGVGPRSAERIALWMVQARARQPEEIAQAITSTRASVRPCTSCGFFATEELCEICADPTRARELLCVVEQPTDILPLEKTSAFRGRYHALGGRISPLDHVGPEDLRIAALVERVKTEGFAEVILALAGYTAVVETVFAWPGIGFLAYNAIVDQDLILLQAIVFLVAIFVVVINILIDVLYRVIDPRIQLA